MLLRMREVHMRVTAVVVTFLNEEEVKKIGSELKATSSLVYKYRLIPSL